MMKQIKAELDKDYEFISYVVSKIHLPAGLREEILEGYRAENIGIDDALLIIRNNIDPHDKEALRVLMEADVILLMDLILGQKRSWLEKRTDNLLLRIIRFLDFLEKVWERIRPKIAER